MYHIVKLINLFLCYSLFLKERNKIKLQFDHGKYIFVSIYIRLVGKVFANGPGDRGSIPVQITYTKDLKKKMILNATLLNTQHYKVRIKIKVEQSRDKSNALRYASV